MSDDRYAGLDENKTEQDSEQKIEVSSWDELMDKFADLEKAQQVLRDDMDRLLTSLRGRQLI